MKTIQEMLQELSQCIVTVSGEFRFRTNWNGGKVPQPEPEKPDLDTFDPNVPFCIENVGDVPASIQYNTNNANIRISKDYKTWTDYTSDTEIELNPKDRVYIKSDYVLDDEPATPRFHFTNVSGTRLRARGNIASLIYGTGDEYITKYTIATQYCYNYMFANCKSLVQAPELPATTLADYCYDSMFDGCASLTQAPVLSATTLALKCYSYMFRGCTSLVQAPELPAIALANSCYNFMFKGCASLTQAPELPATTLADYCYSNMFKGCTSLTSAPELSATTLVNSCYYAMFSGCKKLNYVKCLATDTSATNCTKNWLSGVSATGTFECDNKRYFTVDSPNGIPVGWTITEINPAQPEPEKPDLDVFDPNVPFCIENVGDVPASVRYNTKNTNIRISKDYKTWNDYTTGDSIALDPTERVYIKSDYVKDLGTSPRFVFNGDGARLRARGNIASLIYGSNDAYVNKYTSTEVFCYQCMFSGCTSLVQAPELPATKLNYTCYARMFMGCTSLTQAPELPSIYVVDDCYNSMFSGCASLTQAPALPATKLADYCYNNMLKGCTSLTKAPELPVTTLAFGCYSDMFSGCTSLTRAPELPATTLADWCYARMFQGCSSLTQAPELPATTLVERCYSNMFQYCKKLNYVKCLATDTSATDCTIYWLYGVATTGDFYAPASTNWTTGGSGIPQGWTRHDIT